MSAADHEYARLMRLLDLGLASLRAGDGDSALMALKEGVATAERLPKKPIVIPLPDRSREILP